MLCRCTGGDPEKNRESVKLGRRKPPAKGRKQRGVKESRSSSSLEPLELPDPHSHWVCVWGTQHHGLRVGSTHAHAHIMDIDPPSASPAGGGSGGSGGEPPSPSAHPAPPPAPPPAHASHHAAFTSRAAAIFADLARGGEGRPTPSAGKATEGAARAGGGVWSLRAPSPAAPGRPDA
jgi:hypothetical protein